MNRFLCILLYCILSMGISLYAQQMPRFSQYIINEFIINPSVAGADGRTAINLAARKEWVGFSQNTPETFSLSAQTRILKSPVNVMRKKAGNKVRGSKGRVGIGANIFTDKNGAIKRTGFQATYAYHITKENSQYSFGLTGSLFQLKFNSADLVFKNEDSEIMTGMINNSVWTPDFGIGFNYLTRNFHVGASVAQIFQSPVTLNNSGVNFNSSANGYKRNYFVIAAFHKEFKNNPHWEYEPSILLKMYDLFNFKGNYNGPGSQIDISWKLFYLNKYWFGLSVRTTADFIVMGGFKTNNDIYFSYAFDYGTSNLSINSFGSHEITISSKFGDSARRYRWIERY